ncbi:MAG: double-strand break repair helicase AddA [Alphaproteobacteria bacterium]
MTESQLNASNPNSSVWVAASAGTGKTKILTDRVLRLLLEGNSPAKILCLTFTKAAAAEMSIRINKELSEWATMEDENLKKRLTLLCGVPPASKALNYARKLFIQVLDAEESLKIQTIHSFCQFLIKKFPLESDIAPSFKVLDDQTAKILIREAKTNLLTKISKNLNDLEIASIQQSVNYIAWNLYESGIEELIEEIISKGDKITKILQHHGDLRKFLESLCTKLEMSSDLDEKALLNQFCSEKEYFKELQEIADMLITEGSSTEKNKGEAMMLWLSLKEEDRIIKIIDYKSLFLTKENEALKSVLTKKLATKYPHMFEILKKEQSRILDLIEKQKALKLYVQTMHILRFSEALLKEYKILKQRQLYLDYNDLILVTHKLLTNLSIRDWILYKLDGGIDHVLVDEAQDTSKEQWQIIESLTTEFFSGQGARNKNRTLFVVGDEKQSIFSFQGADPSTFNYMHNYFRDRASYVSNSFQSIRLDISFRSSRAVLALVDQVFKNNGTNSIHSETADLKHQAFRNKDAGSVELWPLIDIHNDKFEDEPWPLPVKAQYVSNPAQKLAELIATKIETWLSSGKILPSKGRLITPGDILILVRRRNVFIEYLVKELKKRSIAVAGIDRMIITEHIAIMDLVALTKFLLLPDDDLNLACILKSPLIGISEDELFNLAYNRKKSLWETLKDKSKAKEIYAKSYEYLNDLLEKIDLYTPFNLYSEIIEVREGRKKFHARLGVEVNDPLDEFLDLALKYEINYASSLQGFLDWLNATKIEIKRDLDQGKDQIRIMTIHGAKGLQAPIVFLPDTTFKVTNQDNLLLCEKTQFLFWPGKTTNYNSIAKELKKINLLKEENESNRLLYVALTRAEDEMIICGYKNKNALSENCWYSFVKKAMKEIAEEKDFHVKEEFVQYLSKDKLLQLEYAQEREIKLQEPNSNLFDQINSIPDYALQPAPQENNFLISPSKLTNIITSKTLPESLSNKCLRGSIIHKLLEYLPLIKTTQFESAAKDFLLKHSSEFNTSEIEKIIATCGHLLRDEEFKKIYSNNSKAEVPITGVIKDKYLVSGQIDRLVIDDEKVLIVDYKTTNNVPNSPENTPQNYLKQMAAYRYLLKEIYPKKQVNCALIWTSIPYMMNLPNELLDNVSLSSILID